MNQENMNQLQAIVGADYCFCNEPMDKHTTFRTGGPAEVLIQPDMDSFAAAILYLRDAQIPYLVIGNGSNLLVGDGGIDGVVVEIGKRMSEIVIDGERITAQAGALLSTMASRAAEHELTGLEFASGIPGSVGGAVFMNAGAYGSEMKNVLVEATVLGADGQIRTVSNEEMELSYRHSALMENGSLVLQATVVLQKGNKDEIYAYMDELKEKRVSKQPLEYPSAGSTFKRPEGYFAGKLIEDAQLKGFQVGGAQVSKKHSGFVVNVDHATSADVLELMDQVKAKVLQQFGVELEPEVRLVGKFLPYEAN